MKAWVLMKNGHPVRVYFTESRAKADFALVSQVRSESDHLTLEEAESIA